MANSVLSVGVELLWTNPSQSSNFPSKKVELDLTKYQFVFVEGSLGSAFVRVGGNGFMTITNGYPYFRTRTVSASSDGVSFGKGYQQSTEDNSNNIPYRIYGIILTH